MNAVGLGGWSVQLLADCVDRIVETVSPDTLRDENTWYLDLERIEAEGTGVATPIQLDTMSVPRSSKLRFRKGDVLYAKLRPYLNKVWVADRDGVCTSELFVLRCRRLVTPNYLGYYLRSAWVLKATESWQKGANLPRIDFDVLGRLPVPIPPVGEEQEKIVSLCDDCRQLRLWSRKQSELLETLLPSAFHHFFGEQITQKRSEFKPLGELADVVAGLQLSPSRDGESGNATKYVRVANVYRNRIDLTDVKTMRVSHNELQSRQLQAGDVLVVEGHGNLNELGRAAIWGGEEDMYVHQNHILRVRVQSSRLLPEYLAGLLNSQYGRNYILRHGNTTSGLNTLSTNVLRDLPVYLAPISTQERFVALHREAIKWRGLVLSRFHLANRLFESVLWTALQGQFAVDSYGTAFSDRDEDNSNKDWIPLSHVRPVVDKLKVSQQSVWEHTLNVGSSFTLRQLQAFFNHRVIQTGRRPPWPSSEEALRRTLDFLVNLGALVVDRSEGSLVRWRSPNPEIDHMEV